MRPRKHSGVDERPPHDIRIELLLEKLASSVERLSYVAVQINDTLARLAYAFESVAETHFENEPTDQQGEPLNLNIRKDGATTYMHMGERNE